MKSRSESFRRIKFRDTPWDLLVIGGGATGLGVAVDAASRGYDVLLLEADDFAKGTSSRSTKLIHGGVRYLKQGNIGLVLESLRERGRLCRNASHLVKHQSFIVPIYTWWEGPFYGVGLKLYDRLAGELGLAPSRVLSREETLERIPTLEPEGLKCGVMYYDGQFDDARLAVHLAITASEQGAVIMNHAEVERFIKEDGRIAGAMIRDTLNGQSWTIKAKVYVNATGVFTDIIRRMDDADTAPLIRASRGTHIVLPREFLPGDAAIMVPHTPDGRVLFAVPWQGHTVVGTTDVPVESVCEEPEAAKEEVAFLLKQSARYLSKVPTHADILSVFSGLRPLVSTGQNDHTAGLSRDHHISLSPGGLLTITGGKWTTYRKMAEDVVNVAESIADLGPTPCVTTALAINGGDQPHYHYLHTVDVSSRRLLHERLPYTVAHVLQAIRCEMAMTLEDVLARRLRALFLDAHAAMEMVPEVSDIMARELKWSEEQKNIYRDRFLQTAKRYTREYYQ